jgi:hypothetical protein
MIMALLACGVMIADIRRPWYKASTGPCLEVLTFCGRLKGMPSEGGASYTREKGLNGCALILLSHNHSWDTTPHRCVILCSSQLP